MGKSSAQVCVLFLAIFTFMLIGLSSCNVTRVISHKPRAAKLDPVQPKDNPVAKMYVVPKKRLNILGHERPQR